MDDFPSLRLRPHQADFVDQFLVRSDSRTLLIAGAGMGKTVTTRATATRMLKQGLADRVLFVADQHVLKRDWENNWPFGAKLGDVITASLATTHAELARDPDSIWRSAIPGTRWLLLFDGIEGAANRLETIASDALSRFPGSRALFVGQRAPDWQVDSKFAFDHAFFDPDALAIAETQAHLRPLAPSIPLLVKIQRKLLQLDDLNWRQFEQLIAQMLEFDGYQVELMKGTKDGGVDVVAIRDLGGAGLFKSVWQAKKLRADRKVQLSIVRELADTRLEHGASKAIIVTTSVLTRGALARIERDRYLLGKVERNDLDRWIDRMLADG
ncbi:restriction endonuclease [Acetobacter sacchari]|uniref:Restriction endonuclease n=1 Tax=Acetobacter sacchari TaxID=2661687 RepID=A0ABS3LRW7_9PROT|nr:restriction endonuclease [Acetobacter sacchari]MBO1358658.1 restriction endonuclease [Acetobacter sacchari]